MLQQLFSEPRRSLPKLKTEEPVCPSGQLQVRELFLPVLQLPNMANSAHIFMGIIYSAGTGSALLRSCSAMSIPTAWTGQTRAPARWTT